MMGDIEIGKLLKGLRNFYDEIIGILSLNCYY
jgi:hypothetical protein